MNKKERDVLHSLCNGDITFTEAATLLETSEEKVEELLGDYTWIPSPEKLSELRDIAMENFRYIELEIRKEKILEHIQHGSIMIFKIDDEEQQKIEKWLSDIRVEDMYFPKLTYSFTPLAGIGIIVKVKERITNKELDLTDESKW